MATKVTPARQSNAVSQGVALGLAMLGYDTLPADKLTIDFAFAHAWRLWPYVASFPSVDAEHRRHHNGYHIVSHGRPGRQLFAFEWYSTHPLRARSLQYNWTVEDEEDLAFAARLIAEDVPAAAWRDLAVAMVAHIGEEAMATVQAVT